ncbi:hypothetical protein [Ideonella sp. A 288]|uniref:hypothetical protein n=1 Tax=Ideonella sp. A 288 TaxID=1962181 RepID=UPI000B4BAFC8|nr:hypothetical protein [Ideonella sp. A 288]
MTTHQCLPSMGRRAMIAATAALSAGCANVVDIAERHGDANLVQERVMNQQLLLNVVRAAHRQPLHFSRIPYIKLPLASSSPWEFTFPFGDVGSYTRNSVKTSVGGGLITVEVSPQDSQEFIQGITTPVRLGMMELYLQQGWPKQLVIYLMVEEIRLYRKTDAGQEIVLRFRNDPGDPNDLDRFAEAVDDITACDLAISPEPAKFGPALAPLWNAPLAGVPEAMQAGVVGLNGKVMSLQLAPGSRFKLVPRAGEADPKNCLPADSDKTQISAQELRSSNVATKRETLMQVIRKSGAVDRRTAQTTSETGPSAYSAEFVMRSPDSMIYYLGEVLRNGGKVTVRRDRDDSRATLFTVTAGPVGFGSAPEAAAVWVDHWGTRYAIPRADSLGAPASLTKPKDRSMQTLALVGQILQLQNKASAPPRSALVRVEP